ncbi:hypothetical protein FRAHR75_220049 [Frankia sp. Hr75.2]|nr:hypothetical protein FRAHR75_220049 [Frankia sp. Hr75.2]
MAGSFLGDLRVCARAREGDVTLVTIPTIVSGRRTTNQTTRSSTASERFGSVAATPR